MNMSTHLNKECKKGSEQEIDNERVNSFKVLYSFL